MRLIQDPTLGELMLLLQDLEGGHVGAVGLRQDHRSRRFLSKPAQTQSEHDPGLLALEVTHGLLARLVSLLQVHKAVPGVQPAILGFANLLLLGHQGNRGKHRQPGHEEWPADIDLDEWYAVPHALNIGRTAS